MVVVLPLIVGALAEHEQSEEEAAAAAVAQHPGP